MPEGPLYEYFQPYVQHQLGLFCLFSMTLASLAPDSNAGKPLYMYDGTHIKSQEAILFTPHLFGFCQTVFQTILIYHFLFCPEICLPPMIGADSERRHSSADQWKIFTFELQVTKYVTLPLLNVEIQCDKEKSTVHRFIQRISLDARKACDYRRQLTILQQNTAAVVCLLHSRRR